MSWRHFAECLEVSLEEQAYFFSEDLIEQTAAQVICSGCWIREQCLEYAITTAQPLGVWGMHTLEDRRWIRRRVSRTSDLESLWWASYDRVTARMNGVLGVDIETAERPVVTAI